MTPRRSHKKSRAGCQRCKQRKIKCDELHPTCGNCSKHGVSCDFDGTTFIPSPPAGSPALLQSQFIDASITRPSSQSSPTSSMILYQSPEPSTSMSNYSGSSHGMELRLMHNYTAGTAKTLATNSTIASLETWQISVPSMAFEAPCLMDAILAVSALHLRAQNPDDHSLVRASHGYMASAISQYMSCLKRGVDASNAEALFTTSALIAFQASAARRFQVDNMESQEGSENYVLPTGWFHAFQGVKVVVLAGWKWLRQSERVRPIIQAQPALALDFSSSRLKFFDFLLEGLEEQLDQIEEHLRLETRQAYEHAVAYLNWAHPKPHRARILGFPATVSQRFVKLIDQHDQRALVIISCFFAMTKVVDDVWWLERVALLEVNGILSLLQPEWRQKMDWAVRVAHHEGPMDEETWGTSRTFPEATKTDDDGEGDGNLHAHIDILASLTPALD